MSPANYLRKLQKEACGYYKIPFEKFNEAETVITNLTNAVIQRLERLGQPYADLLKIPIGSLPIWDFNASICDVEGHQIIVLNWGLRYSLESLNQAIVAMVENVENVENKDIMPLVETALTCSFAIRYGALAFAIKWPAIPEITCRSAFSKMIVSQIAFVLCHEYAHALLGHLNNTIRFNLPSGNPVIIESFTHEQNHEFDADQKAIDLLNKVLEDEKDICYGAVYRFFRLVHLCEIMYPTDEPSVSHPPAIKRWDKIESSWPWGTDQSNREIGLEDFRATKRFFDMIDDAIINIQKENPDFLKTIRSDIF